MKNMRKKTWPFNDVATNWTSCKVTQHEKVDIEPKASKKGINIWHFIDAETNLAFLPPIDLLHYISCDILWQQQMDKLNISWVVFAVHNFRYSVGLRFVAKATHVVSYPACRKRDVQSL